MILLDFQGKLCTLFLNTFPAVNELTENSVKNDGSGNQSIKLLQYEVYNGKNVLLVTLNNGAIMRIYAD